MRCIIGITFLFQQKRFFWRQD